MAVIIRLNRTGRRNDPRYRLVVMDSRNRRDGRPLEILGHYNPTNQPAEFKIQEDRALDWLGKGARMSDTVKSLFKRTGILEKHTGVKYAAAGQETEKMSKKARKRLAKQEQKKAEEAQKKEEAKAAGKEAPAEEAKAEQAPPAEETPAETTEEKPVE
jgi:small subunit ribosomal protein S16